VPRIQIYFETETIDQMAQEPVLCSGIILSDAVIREHGTGKLSIIGSFSGYNFPSFPFAAPPFVATVLLTNLEGVLERFPVTVRIELARISHVLASSVSEVTVDRQVQRAEIFEVPIAIPQVNYPEAGIYKVRVLAQDEALGQRDLIVRPLATSQP
jgi:hypothetical protein